MEEIDALHRARPIKSQNRHRSSKPSKFARTSDFQVDEVIRESFPATGIDHRVPPPLSLSRRQGQWRFGEMIALTLGDLIQPIPCGQ